MKTIADQFWRDQLAKQMPPELQTIADEHYQNLYRFALSLTRSGDDAWDLTQEAFLKLAQNRSSIRSTKAIKSWLYTTLYREFIRISKRSSRYENWEDFDTVETNTHSRADQLKKLEANDVMDCLMRVKEGYRQVVSLYFLESYSYKEIADILNVPIGTVMSRLSRGKEMLKAALLEASTPKKVVNFSTQKGDRSHG